MPTASDVPTHRSPDAGGERCPRHAPRRAAHHPDRTRHRGPGLRAPRRAARSHAAGDRRCPRRGVRLDRGAYRLAALDAAQLAGTLVVLPIVNRTAYRVRAIYGDPIDGKNLNRQFPGDPAGSFAPRLAHWLTDGWVRHADTYLDLHGGDLNEALTPFALYARGDERARALAEAFGIPYVIASGSAGHSSAAAAALGVPAVPAEAGGQGLFPERNMLTLVGGSRRAMRHLGMLEGTPTPRATVPVEHIVVLTSEHEGRWYPRVGLEARVEAGQPLVEVRDLPGGVVQEVTAPVSGTVLYYVATLAIDRSEPLVGIGVTAMPD